MSSTNNRSAIQTYYENALCNGLLQVILSLMDEVKNNKNIAPSMYLRELQNFVRALAISDQSKHVNVLRMAMYQYEQWRTLCIPNASEEDVHDMLSNLVKASCRTVWNRIDLFNDTRKNYTKIMGLLLENVVEYANTFNNELKNMCVGGGSEDPQKELANKEYEQILNDSEHDDDGESDIKFDIDESDDGPDSPRYASPPQPDQTDALHELANNVPDDVADLVDVVHTIKTDTGDAPSANIDNPRSDVIASDPEPQPNLNRVQEQHQHRKNSFLKKWYEHTLRQQTRKKNLKTILKTSNTTADGSNN